MWALIGDRCDPGTATVGLLRPWIVFSPRLAKRLDDRQIEAALAHEQAHARHRDPLRILLVQLATDLQWPWPQARERMRRWLLALELARDEEARAAGIDGIELADAIVASARFGQQKNPGACAALTGDVTDLEERIARLLEPLREPRGTCRDAYGSLLMTSSLLMAVALGSVFGERVVRALFLIAA
jgi:beta-lactamase regulating signal transducer with metallopeptidase domain